MSISAANPSHGRQGFRMVAASRVRQTSRHEQNYSRLASSSGSNLDDLVQVFVFQLPTSNFDLDIPVQVGPEGLGAPFCKCRMVWPKCTSYNLAEPNVHRCNFLLQNGRISWPLVTEWCPILLDLHPLARIRSSWAFTEWLGLGVAIKRILLGSLDNNPQQPGRPDHIPESPFIFPVLFRCCCSAFRRFFPWCFLSSRTNPWIQFAHIF